MCLLPSWLVTKTNGAVFSCIRACVDDLYYGVYYGCCTLAELAHVLVLSDGIAGVGPAKYGPSFRCKHALACVLALFTVPGVWLLRLALHWI